MAAAPCPAQRTCWESGTPSEPETRPSAPGPTRQRPGNPGETRANCFINGWRLGRWDRRLMLHSYAPESVSISTGRLLYHLVLKRPLAETLPNCATCEGSLGEYKEYTGWLVSSVCPGFVFSWRSVIIVFSLNRLVTLPSVVFMFVSELEFLGRHHLPREECPPMYVSCPVLQ